MNYVFTSNEEEIIRYLNRKIQEYLLNLFKITLKAGGGGGTINKFWEIDMLYMDVYIVFFQAHIHLQIN